MINDAAIQAFGSDEDGRLLFLGLGTGLGSALITDGALAPMELAHLRYRKGRTYEDCVGLRELKRYGKKTWRRYVMDIVTAVCLRRAKKRHRRKMRVVINDGAGPDSAGAGRRRQAVLRRLTQEGKFQRQPGRGVVNDVEA